MGRLLQILRQLVPAQNKERSVQDRQSSGYSHRGRSRQRSAKQIKSQGQSLKQSAHQEQREEAGKRLSEISPHIVSKSEESKSNRGA